MTVLPERLLTGRDEKTADEHEQAAEELLAAAATHLHGGTSRRRTERAAVLATLAQGHMAVAEFKSKHPDQV